MEQKRAYTHSLPVNPKIVYAQQNFSEFSSYRSVMLANSDFYVPWQAFLYFTLHVCGHGS